MLVRCAIRLSIIALAGLSSCRTPPQSDAPAQNASAGAQNAPAAAQDAAAAGTKAPDTPLASSGPPAVERTCTRDDECAVARIETSGERVCCAACGTTPGTRRWHAKLQRFCASHSKANCPPLACPMGPTRAVCRAGSCEATATAADGGTAMVLEERRCLPALVCDAWAGCALVVGNTQDGWFVEESERVARGEIAGLDRVAIATEAGPHRVADVLRLHPPGITCPPHTIPPILPPAPACALKDGHCKRR